VVGRVYNCSNSFFVLFSVIRGVGELDTGANQSNNNPEEREENQAFSNSYQTVVAPDPISLPYLLLDIRDSDVFDEAHIIGGRNKIRI